LHKSTFLPDDISKILFIFQSSLVVSIFHQHLPFFNKSNHSFGIAHKKMNLEMIFESGYQVT